MCGRELLTLCVSRCTARTDGHDLAESRDIFRAAILLRNRVQESGRWVYPYLWSAPTITDFRAQHRDGGHRLPSRSAGHSSVGGKFPGRLGWLPLVQVSADN